MSKVMWNKEQGTRNSIFLSIVLVVNNISDILEEIIKDKINYYSKLVRSYELIIIDNASNDNSEKLWEKLTNEKGYPNLQIYSLSHKIDDDAAAWVGVSRILGDYVIILDPLINITSVIPQALNKAISGYDIVFLINKNKSSTTNLNLTYKFASYSFSKIYELLHDVNLKQDLPQIRILSRNVVNFILQHSDSDLTYRYLPMNAEFSRAYLEFDEIKTFVNKDNKNIKNGFDKALRLLTSKTKLPMRFATIMSLFGAFANLIYSLYVVVVAIFKSDVAEGWISLSLQQSGMFFLFSLVLFIIGEYLLQINSSTNSNPVFHIKKEYTSAKLTSKQILNIEELEGIL